MMRHTCRAAALTFFGVAFGSCQPEAANVERIRRLELENNIETTAGGRYLEAVARRDSVSALRASLRARGDSLTAKMEALNQEADTAAMLEMAEVEGLDLTGADSAAALGFLREYYSEMTATLEEAAELDGEFEELREGDASRSFRYALFTACAPVKLSRFGETGILREAGVREMAESRLRAARIGGGQEPDNGELSPLALHIDYGARNATFRKEVWEPLSGEFHIADVWTHSLSGGEAETDISQRASTLIDRFILEYLRVNEGDCR